MCVCVCVCVCKMLIKHLNYANNRLFLSDIILVNQWSYARITVTDRATTLE